MHNYSGALFEFLSLHKNNLLKKLGSCYQKHASWEVLRKVLNKKSETVKKIKLVTKIEEVAALTTLLWNFGISITLLLWT